MSKRATARSRERARHRRGRGGSEPKPRARGRPEPIESGLYGAPVALPRARVAVGRVVSLATLATGAAYLVWRATTVSGTGVLGAAFLAAETISFLALALTAVLLLRMRFRPLGEVPPPRGSLDVFIPVCGEPQSLVEESLKAALAIRYPHRTFLLNDGLVAGKPNWREPEEIARRFGVPCLTRTAGPRGKAANLNNGVAASGAQFVAVIDADHRADPAFAHETLGYFRDSQVAFVTTPQQFETAPSDPLNNRELFFYRAIQAAKDADASAFSCGNAVVYRRAALDSVGGFSEWNIVEDLHTSYELHAAGWKSVYHPRALTLGKAPETVAALVKQRLAWATDSLRILFWDNPLRKPGLSLRQRLHYLQTTSFYLVATTQILFLATPALYLLWGVPVMRFGSGREYAAATFPYLGSLVLFLLSFGGFKGGLRVVQQQLFLAPVYLLAAARAATRVRFASGVTEKGPPSRFSPLLVAPYALLALSLAAVLHAAADPAPSKVIATGWAGWTIVMLGGFATAVGLPLRLADAMALSLRAAVATAVATVLFASAAVSPSPLASDGAAVGGGAAATSGRGDVWTVRPSARGISPPPKRAKLAPPPRGAYLGVYTPSVLAANAVSEWNRRHSVRARLVNWYQQWGSGERRFRADWLAGVARQHAVPMITWEPWAKPRGSVHGAKQPAYRLAAIASGRYDRYVRSWARAAAAYRRPLLVRFMHEMNGNWYPWSVRANGGDAKTFVRAWRRVHRIFEREGADNVSWVWAVNSFAGMTGGTVGINRYYPGRRFVDWVSVTGFNWGDSYDWNAWRTADEIFAATYRELTRFRKPIMISEIATVPRGGDEAAWIEASLARLRASYPRVDALVWFDAPYPGEVDFRLRGRAAAAFTRAIRRSRYWQAPLRITALER